MDLSKIIHRGLEEIKQEIYKEGNMSLIKNDILNPAIKHIIEQLYPYFIKVIFIIITLFILLIVIIFLNIRIIYKKN
tara:strand:+ start:174 stop:404 length:231 start_codon:yes stop_codon:yes gene_type:complete